MARRVSGGVTGEPSIGAIQVAPTAVVTAATDQNITLSPTGTASVVITNNTILNAQSDLRFADADSSNYVAFQGASTISSNVTWTLPSADGSANQAIVTNGSGVLSFATAGASLTDNNSDSGTNYLTFTTGTSGNLTAARVASTTRALTYQPSTGTLSSTILSGAGVFTTVTASGTVGITATTTARHINPEATNTYDLGTSSVRWRTIYTTDLELSNGIGDYTVVEGEEDLFIYNNKNGKTYKFLLQEVDKSTVPPKKAATPGA